MKNEQAFEQDLASIHQLMERSVKFISLSGLSGILSGLYALLGAGAAYSMTLYPASLFERQSSPMQDVGALKKLVFIAVLVLIASLGTGLWLSSRKARRMGAHVWGPAGKRLLLNLLIPLVTGGLFVLLCLWLGYFEIVTASCLIFYGLALVNASPSLFDEVRYLGLFEIALGLLSMSLPGYSLLFWSLGFGVLHIVYGVALHRKYR